MRQKSIKRFRGLQLTANSFDKEGALEIADNVVILQDNILQSRRGRYSFIQLPNHQLANNLFLFKDSTLIVSQDTLYQVKVSQAATIDVSAGSSTLTINLPAHGIAANSFVFDITTSSPYLNSLFAEGAKDFGQFRLVDAVTTNDFDITADSNASATYAAVPVTFNYYTAFTSSSPISITADGIGVSYSTKANKNLYFTTDNGVFKVESLVQQVIPAGIPTALDLTAELVQASPIGTGALPANGQVSYKVLFGRKDANNNKVLGAPSPAMYLTNSVGDAITGGSVSLSGGNIVVTQASHPFTSTNDYAYVTAATTTGGTLVPPINLKLFAVTPGVSFTLTTSPFGLVSVNSITYGVKKNAALRFSIPTGIQSTEYFYQIYRTSVSINQNTAADVDYKLIDELNLTAGQVAAGFVDYTDTLSPELADSGSVLYTNPGAEGALQTNDMPPFCKDLATWKDMTFYANVKQYRTLDFSLLAAENLQNNDTFTIGGSNAFTFIMKSNATDQPAGNEKLTDVSTLAGTTITITHTNHGFSINDIIYVYSASAITGVVAGFKTITAAAANTFAFVQSGAGGAGGTVTYEGVRDASNRYFVKVYKNTTGTPALTLAQTIDKTARLLVKAINRYTTCDVYAIYLFTDISAPGNIRLLAKSFSTVNFFLNSTSTAKTYSPILPVSGQTVASTQDVFPGGIYVSKLGEPEAVPLVNYYTVGDVDKNINRIVPLRDSVIILKEDGVFRLNGDIPENVSIIPLDYTTTCVATDSVRSLNNSVYFLSDQGVAQVTDTSVRIVSRDIEPVLNAVVNKDLESICSAVASETDRLYMLTTIKPNTANSAPNVTRTYNYLTDTWTDFVNPNVIAYNSIIDSSDKIVSILASNQNVIVSQRKNQNRIDYIEEEETAFFRQGQWCTIETLNASAVVTITFPFEHGLTNSRTVTLSELDTGVLAAFSSSTDIVGVFRVGTVLNKYKIQIIALNPAIATVSGYGITSADTRELTTSFKVSSGSTEVVVDTVGPHYLLDGQVIVINWVDPLISGSFTTINDCVGARTVTVVSSVQFTYNADSPSGNTFILPGNYSSNTKEKFGASISTTLPRVGDAFFATENIYLIDSVVSFDNERTTNKFLFEIQDSSYEKIKLGRYIKERIKFSPLLTADVGQLKYSSEFQTSFRNGASCTRMNVSFSSDSVSQTAATEWNYTRDGTLVSNDGWGQLDWGDSSWGGGVSLNKQFITRPAVIMRTYIPMDVFVGTFIQPTLEHKQAGESMDIQSISIYNATTTVRTSR